MKTCSRFVCRMFLVLAPTLSRQAHAEEGEGTKREPVPTVGPRELVLDGDPVPVLLPPDAIPSIDAPELVTADEADELYLPDEPIMGVVIEGEARAWSLWHLDRHEIVNDVVGGQPIAATW